jgi:hypothetical protein
VLRTLDRLHDVPIKARDVDESLKGIPRHTHTFARSRIPWPDVKQRNHGTDVFNNNADCDIRADVMHEHSGLPQDRVL